MGVKTVITCEVCNRTTTVRWGDGEPIPARCRTCIAKDDDDNPMPMGYDDVWFWCVILILLFIAGYSTYRTVMG